MDVPPFTFDYAPGAIHYGYGCVAALADELAASGSEAVLLVCGGNVGANEATMEPVRTAIGDLLAGVFDETTPEKNPDTAHEGVDRMRAVKCDALVAVGGGSSIDTARVMSVLEAEDESLDAIQGQLTDDGDLEVPELQAETVPVFAVPTTLAGAELTAATGLDRHSVEDGPVTGELRTAGVNDTRMLPAALFLDPAVAATTPPSVLQASVMNGFDHGVEMLYSRNANPVTDAVGIHGLRLLDEALPGAVQAPLDTDALGRAQVGVALTSYGFIAGPHDKKNAIVHGIANKLRYYDVQQGAAHGIVAPHALEYVFDRVDGRRTLLADSLGIPVVERSRDDLADDLVRYVRTLRDDLGLPSRLRSIPDLERDHLPGIADAATSSETATFGPPGLEPASGEVLTILEQAW